MYNINSHINVNFFQKLQGEAGNVPLVTVKTFSVRLNLGQILNDFCNHEQIFSSKRSEMSQLLCDLCNYRLFK